MGRDNHPRQRQARKLVRKTHTRRAYDRILIVTEGERTEPDYFASIRQHYRLHTATVQVQKTKGTSPLQVVKFAEALFLKGDTQRGVTRRAFEQVFAVFDRDQHAHFSEAIEHCKALHKTLKNDENRAVAFHSIASAPCFELWLLLHFQEAVAPLPIQSLIKKLQSHVPGYSKSSTQNFFRTHQHLLSSATQRAQQLAEAPDPGLYTDVHSLVQKLICLKKA